MKITKHSFKRIESNELWEFLRDLYLSGRDFSSVYSDHNKNNGIDGWTSFEIYHNSGDLSRPVYKKMQELKEFDTSCTFYRVMRED